MSIGYRILKTYFEKGNKSWWGYVKQLAKMSDGMIPITGIRKGLIREIYLSGRGLDKDVAVLLAGLMEHLNTVTVDKLGTIAVERGCTTS